MPKLQTSTLSNQNISSALLVGTFTADKEYSSLMVQVMLDQVGGNGDYKIYLTHQLGGAGSAYKSGVLTDTLASGETAHKFGSLLIPVNSGDVIKVYVQGLAGDTTTPDIVCEFWDLGYLRPTVAGRTVDVSATGEVGLDFANIGQASAPTILNNLTIPIITALTNAPEDSAGVTALLQRIVGTLATGTHKPQSGDAFARLGAPSGDSIAADIAAIEPDPAAAVLDALAADHDQPSTIGAAINNAGGGNIIVQASVAISEAVAASVSKGNLAIETWHTCRQSMRSTTMRDLTAATKIYMAIKKDKLDDDDEAVLYLSVGEAGLSIVDGDPYETHGHGALTVTGEPGDWELVFYLNRAVAGMFEKYIQQCHYAGIKALFGENDDADVWQGETDYSAGVVKAVS
jgi:hypothetical protein